jgi:hypothetical protein
MPCINPRKTAQSNCQGPGTPTACSFCKTIKAAAPSQSPSKGQPPARTGNLASPLPGSQTQSPVPRTGNLAAAPPSISLAELRQAQQTHQAAALQKVLEVDQSMPETISDGPPAWNKTFTIKAKFAMQVTQSDLIVRIRLKMPDVRWGIGEVPAMNVWCSKVNIAWAGCSLFWKRQGTTTEKEYPIKVEIEVVESGQHHTITAQDPSTVGHGATAGLGGTTSMTNWGVLDGIDIAHEVGHMLGNPENYFTVVFRNETKRWGAARQAGMGIMNNPAESPLAEHFLLVKEKFPDLMQLNAEQGTVTQIKAPPPGTKSGWKLVNGGWVQA